MAVWTCIQIAVKIDRLLLRDYTQQITSAHPYPWTIFSPINVLNTRDLILLVKSLRPNTWEMTRPSGWSTLKSGSKICRLLETGHSKGFECGSSEQVKWKKNALESESSLLESKKSSSTSKWSRQEIRFSKVDHTCLCLTTQFLAQKIPVTSWWDQNIITASRYWSSFHHSQSFVISEMSSSNSHLDGACLSWCKSSFRSIVYF